MTEWERSLKRGCIECFRIQIVRVLPDDAQSGSLRICSGQCLPAGSATRPTPVVRDSRKRRSRFSKRRYDPPRWIKHDPAGKGSQEVSSWSVANWHQITPRGLPLPARKPLIL